MAQKNNIRSIRFSDEMADLIDRQVGRTFTEKFENLITRCVWELPQKEEQLKRIQEQIDQERQRLYDLQTTAGKLKRLKMYIENAEDHVKSIMLQAKAVAEAAGKEGM